MSDDQDPVRAELDRVKADLAKRDAELTKRDAELARLAEVIAKLQHYLRRMLRGRFGPNAIALSSGHCVIALMRPHPRSTDRGVGARCAIGRTGSGRCADTISVA